ncbi:MAG: hypothetical protein M3O15_03605 [Acidobacteriota bacterium]|nr:hypothetical protein [Acidobacteriota bacterium]
MKDSSQRARSRKGASAIRTCGELLFAALTRTRSISFRSMGRPRVLSGGACLATVLPLLTPAWTGAALVLTALLALTAWRFRRLQGRLGTIAREWQLTIDAVEYPLVALDRRGKVVRMNRAAMLLTGRPYAETVGLRLSELGAEEPWRSANQLLAGMRHR